MLLIIMFKKLFALLISLFLFLFVASSSLASTLYLSPANTSVPSGSIVSVSVGLNTSGESINGVSAYLSYPQDLLEVVGISYGGSFPIAAEGTYGAGAIRISRGSISGAVGSVNVATIRFRGKTQGQATVSFVGGSAAPRTSDSSDSLTGTSSSTITVGAPSKTPQTTPAPTGVSTTRPTDTEKPIIGNVTVSQVATNTATITWQTNEGSDSTVEYGLDKDKYFLSSETLDLVTAHKVQLEGEALLPGATMHFRVKSKDKSGNEGVSNDYTFHLKGYKIKVKVLDKKNMPVPNTEVVLYSHSVVSRTDVNGDAYFVDITPGKHLAVVKLKNGFDRTLEVEVAETDSLQTFALSVDTSLTPSFNTLLYLLLAIAVVVGVIGIGVLVFIKKKRSIVV